MMQQVGIRCRFRGYSWIDPLPIALRFGLTWTRFASVFKKCFEYCDKFSKYKDEDVVRKVRQELQEYGNFDQLDEEGNVIQPDDDHMRLSLFEMAQLANLSIQDVEEAKVLIPT